VVDPDRHVKLDSLPDGDSVEVFVDVLNNREQVYNFDDRRVVIAPAEKWYQPLLVAPMSFGHSGKCAATEDGYAAEFWFSAWALGLTACARSTRTLLRHFAPGGSERRSHLLNDLFRSN